MFKRFRIIAIFMGILLAIGLVGSVFASTSNFSQSVVDYNHPLAVFVHTDSVSQLGAKVTWQGAACCANGHINGLTLSVILVDHPGDDYSEIDNNGESCSVGGGKPISCYIGASAFEKGGSAPSGWYIVKVEQFSTSEAETNVKLSVYGSIDQIAPGPTVLYP